MVLKPPYPYFGSKWRVSPLIWKRFGDVPNLVDPFFGRNTLVLSRPHWDNERGDFGVNKSHRTETINDIDCFVANFWRSVKNDPDKVAHYADWPVSEVDLHARHLWLVNQEEFINAMRQDPEYFDPKIAGWWVWGINLWIGGGWCLEDIVDDRGGYAGPRYRHPKLRIALCGLYDEHAPHMPDDWECVAWKPQGGYGNQKKGGARKKIDERIWFSPNCLKPERKIQMRLL